MQTIAGPFCRSAPPLHSVPFVWPGALHQVGGVSDGVAQSPRIAEWHSGFHRQLEALVEDQVSIEISGARRDTEAAVITFAIEGAITHDLSAGATSDLCDSLVQRLAAL